MKIKIHVIDLLNESEWKITPEDFPRVFYPTQECLLVDAEESVLRFDYYLSPSLRRFVTQ